MKTEQIFPTIQIVICLGAAVVYFLRGDARHGIYWSSAAILTGSVTF